MQKLRQQKIQWRFQSGGIFFRQVL